MPERQLDLFAAASGMEHDVPTTAAPSSPPALVAADLDDKVLVTALPTARPKEAPALANEAGRRRLRSAVPALDALCRRFTAFERECAVPEQLAALDGLAALGGAAAAHALSALIVERVVVGSNLARHRCRGPTGCQTAAGDPIRALGRSGAGCARRCLRVRAFN